MMSKHPPQILTIHQRIERGRSIARLYIAAQHLSQKASDEACRLLEEANDPWQNAGFNQVLENSPYLTRASGLHNRIKRAAPDRKQDLKNRITPPWMTPNVAILEVGKV